MVSFYIKFKVEDIKISNNCHIFFSDVNKAMAKSKNYDELLYYWHAWHEATGPQLKNKYIRYVQLANQAARLNGDKIKIIFKRVHINIFSKNFPFSRISFDLFRISECR